MKARGNPLLAVMGNPPGMGDVFASDVLAIVYRHAEGAPDTVMVHTFGGTGSFRERRDGSLLLYDLADETGVTMRSEGEGRRVVLEHINGEPVAAEFV